MPDDLADIQQEITRRQARWTVGDNPMWRLPDPAKRARLGVNPPRFPSAVPVYPATGIALPASFDYRDINGDNFVTPIRDQSECGACVAFGCIAAIEATLNRQRNTVNPALDLSEAHLFFCYGAADSAATVPRTARDAALVGHPTGPCPTP